MTICPIAFAIGCAKCSIVSVCPVKTIIGDYIPPTTPLAKPTQASPPSSGQ